jgi:hypothetical protein
MKICNRVQQQYVAWKYLQVAWCLPLIIIFIKSEWYGTKELRVIFLLEKKSSEMASLMDFGLAIGSVIRTNGS